jgi:hypothetical protein
MFLTPFCLDEAEAVSISGLVTLVKNSPTIVAIFTVHFYTQQAQPGRAVALLRSADYRLLGAPDSALLGGTTRQRCN